MRLNIQRLPHAHDLPLPKYETDGAVGLDLLAALDTAVIMRPDSRLLVPTGIAVAIPFNHEGQVRPRSGLAVRHGLTIPNTPGTIDSDYRGEIKVLLHHAGTGLNKIEITRGMRIAQLVITPIVRVQLCEVDNLTKTERDSGGFGSTGV